jgi:hypothetical protein
MNRAPDTELYERDFFEWIQHNVELLRRGCVEQADLEHIAEEMEGLANRDQREISSRLVVLVMHLLKWKYQPEKRYTRSGKSSWLSTIVEQRGRLEKVLQASPSLTRYAASTLVEDYPRAAKRASLETGIPLNQFPAGCTFTLDQVLDDNFLPD